MKNPVPINFSWPLLIFRIGIMPSEASIFWPSSVAQIYSRLTRSTIPYPLRTRTLRSINHFNSGLMDSFQIDPARLEPAPPLKFHSVESSAPYGAQESAKPRKKIEIPHPWAHPGSKTESRVLALNLAL